MSDSTSYKQYSRFSGSLGFLKWIAAGVAVIYFAAGSYCSRPKWRACGGLEP